MAVGGGGGRWGAVEGDGGGCWGVQGGNGWFADERGLPDATGRGEARASREGVPMFGEAGAKGLREGELGRKCE
jgi:hypothetical protein